MPKPSPKYFPKMRRRRQITDYHCGPAVIQMLLSYININVSQPAIMKAANLNMKHLRQYGMNLDDLAVAVNALEIKAQFWMKNNVDLLELESILNHEFPVGVEWQGDFGKYGDGIDDGHYSIVTNIDDWDGSVSIADPFGPFSKTDRILPLSKFEKLWWDVNEIINPQTGRLIGIKDYHPVFIITSPGEQFPSKLGMIRG